MNNIIIILKIGNLVITISTLLICYLILTEAPAYRDNLFSPTLPCILIVVISFSISSLFMSIYEMACDTVLMCFIYDEDLNKQSGGGSA